MAETIREKMGRLHGGDKIAIGTAWTGIILDATVKADCDRNCITVVYDIGKQETAPGSEVFYIRRREND